jgi:cytochrome c peroxidase
VGIILCRIVAVGLILIGPGQLIQPHAEEALATVHADLLLGDLLFHSPQLFGNKAQKLGLTCDTCHPGGFPEKSLFIRGLSDRPGNFDPKTSFFTTGSIHGRSIESINIPSLLGVNFTPPYGRDGRISSLKIFIENVVTGEFGGSPQTFDGLRALTAYVESLEFLPNRMLNKQGHLTKVASPAARRGELLFHKPFDGLENRSCADCHVPTKFFTDGKVHQRPRITDDPTASLGPYKTQTLLNISVTAPYFHDGRMAEIDDVVSWYDRYFQLGLSQEDRADLGAYLRAVGAVDNPPVAETDRQRFIRATKYLTLLTTGPASEDRQIWAWTLQQLGSVLQAHPGPPAARPAIDGALQNVDAVSAKLDALTPLNELRPIVDSLFQQLMSVAIDWPEQEVGSKQ